MQFAFKDPVLPQATPANPQPVPNHRSLHRSPASISSLVTCAHQPLQSAECAGWALACAHSLSAQASVSYLIAPEPGSGEDDPRRGSTFVCWDNAAFTAKLGQYGPERMGPQTMHPHTRVSSQPAVSVRALGSLCALTIPRNHRTSSGS